MSEQIKLSPCPFCEGPPVPLVRYCGGEKHGAYLDSADIDSDEGSYVRATVFCHECGADGPQEEGFIYDVDDYQEMERKAAFAWNSRNNRHRDLYDAGDESGLNLYPRGAA